MRRLWLYIVVLGVLFVPEVGAADPVPWRGALVDGADTLNIRVDPGIFDTSIQKYWSWENTQRKARNDCIACGASKWGKQELVKLVWARTLKDQSYRPLEDWIFLLVSIEVVGASGTNRTWRFGDDEPVVLTMDNGQVLTSEPPRELPEPSISLDHRSEAYFRVCRQMKLMLAGRVLYRPDELVERAKLNPEYRDDPSNAFVVPFKFRDPPRDFLKHIRGIKLRIANQWVELQSTATATLQAVGSQ